MMNFIDSVSLLERARRVIPGGVNSGARRTRGLDLVIASTKGGTFRDVGGTTYVDFHMAYGPLLLGHNDPDVDRAVMAAMKEIDLTGIGVTRLEIELAERLVDLVPSFEKVLLTCSGSEATFHAVRLSRAATGRQRIIKFQGCFHGWHDSIAMNVISPAGKIGQKDPLSTGIMPEVIDATAVVPFNDLAATRAVFEQYPGEIAAIILEPIPHNIGCVMPEPGFLEGLRNLCDRHGAVLIFDEVVTGFRHALGGFQSISGVTPDLTTVGKAMANGYPIAAVGGRSDLMEMFSTTPGNPVFYAGTFNGHPATVAAALATIEKLTNEPVHEHVFALGEQVRKELKELFKSLGVPAVVAGFGSIWVTYFLEPPVTTFTDLLRNDDELFVAYRLELLKHGIFEIPIKLKRNYLAFAHTEQHVDQLVSATEASVRAVLSRRATI
jgi:glutamate-1-semialdehyde 2,1-aminomutase